MSNDRSCLSSAIASGYDRAIANITLLLALDSSDPPTEYEPPDALLGANYSIPLFWLSMFTSSDIVSWLSTVDQAVSYAATLGSREACIATSGRRLDEWSRRWPETFKELRPVWTDFIASRGEPFFAIWTEELAEMSDSPADWLRILTSYLTALDDPDSAVLEEVLAQSFLAINSEGRLVATSEDQVSMLAGGYAWAATPPWE